MRGPVEPGLTSPAFDLALLSWWRTPMAAEAWIATVEPQTISSILEALEKWSIIPATYISREGRCDAVDVDADPWGASIYTPLRGESAPKPVRVQ